MFTITYKGYTAECHESEEDNSYWGKVIGIDDLVLIEGADLDELTDDFHEAVEEYIDLLDRIASENSPPSTL